jgi:chaperonin cofactor prefoldin
MTFEKMGREIEKRFEDYEKRLKSVEDNVAYHEQSIGKIMKKIREMWGGKTL